MRCRLCGHEFEPSGLACHTSCPLGSHCSLICCPNCGYQVVDESKSWLARLLDRWWPADPLPTVDVAAPCPLARMPTGMAAEVLRLQGMSPQRLARLSVFGLVPGSQVTILQRQPVPVLGIGETELSLSPEILEQIWVQPNDHTAQ